MAERAAADAAKYDAEMARRAAAESALEEKQRLRAARDANIARAAKWATSEESARVEYLADMAVELSSSGRVMLYGRLKDGLERSGHVKKAKVRYLEPGSKAGIKFVDLGHYASAISEGPATLPEPPVNAGVAGGGGEAEAQLAAEDAARREAFEKLRAEHVVAPVAVVDTPGLGQGYKYLKRSETKSYSYYKKFGFAGRGARTSWGHAPGKPPAFVDSPSPAFTI